MAVHMAAVVHMLALHRSDAEIDRLKQGTIHDQQRVVGHRHTSAVLRP